MDGTSSESWLIATFIQAVLKVWVPLPENEFYIQRYGAASVSSVHFAFRLLHVNDLYSDRFRWARVLTDKMYQCFETHHHHHHHHHVHERLGVFPVPWSSKWIWSLRLFLGCPIFLRPFGLYCNACFGILFVSILCMCCSHLNVREL